MTQLRQKTEEDRSRSESKININAQNIQKFEQFLQNKRNKIANYEAEKEKIKYKLNLLEHEIEGEKESLLPQQYKLNEMQEGLKQLENHYNGAELQQKELKNMDSSPLNKAQKQKLSEKLFELRIKLRNAKIEIQYQKQKVQNGYERIQRVETDKRSLLQQHNWYKQQIDTLKRSLSQNGNVERKNQFILKSYSKEANEVAVKIQRNKDQMNQIQSQMQLLAEKRKHKRDILYNEKIELNRLRKQMLSEEENLGKYLQIINVLKPSEEQPLIQTQKEKLKNTIHEIKERFENLQLELQKKNIDVQQAEENVSRIEYHYQIILQKYNEINGRLKILNKILTQLQNKQDIESYKHELE